MAEYLIGYCGLNCGQCEIRAATLANDEGKKLELAAKMTQMTGRPWKSTEISCHGCKAQQEGDWEGDCKIRVCASARGYEYCFQCPEFPCDIYTKWFQKMRVPAHAQGVANLQFMKDYGVDEWVRRDKVTSLMSEVGLSTDHISTPPMALERRAAKIKIKVLEKAGKAPRIPSPLWPKGAVKGPIPPVCGPQGGMKIQRPPPPSPPRAASRPGGAPKVGSTPVAPPRPGTAAPAKAPPAPAGVPAPVTTKGKQPPAPGPVPVPKVAPKPAPRPAAKTRPSPSRAPARPKPRSLLRHAAGRAARVVARRALRAVARVRLLRAKAQRRRRPLRKRSARRRKAKKSKRRAR